MTPLSVDDFLEKWAPQNEPTQETFATEEDYVAIRQEMKADLVAMLATTYDIGLKVETGELGIVGKELPQSLQTNQHQRGGA